MLYTRRVNKKLQEKLKQLPARPGVYFHKSETGEVIYVGKAAVLKNRVRQYFQESRLRDAKTNALVAEIDDTDWIEVESEIDALFLESEMIKRYMPRYNILLRDDKSQMFVRIDMKSEWPIVRFTRDPLDDGAEYFGPFYSGAAIKKALRYLRRVYPYFLKPPDQKNSKLEVQLGLNPDVRAGSKVYKSDLKKLISYINGNRVALQKEIESDMKRAARQQQFEQAAILRNRLRVMQELQRRVMFGDSEYIDISKDQALAQLERILQLRDVPRRIECYDISHLGGRDVVASMVVFTNGVSDRANYRKFKMTKQVNDDAAQMYETIFRRLGANNLNSWGQPDLLIVDGGKPQLAAAIKAQADRGCLIPIIGIAKREEEIIIHRSGSNITLNIEQTPGIILRTEENYLTLNLHAGQHNLGSHTKNLRGEMTISPYTDVVKLFQRIRDEAHRFAISYHSVLARQKQTISVLDEIPGVGPTTKRQLLRKFGSVKGIQEANYADLMAVVGEKRARLVADYLKLQSPK